MWLMFWIPYYNDKEIAKYNYGLHMFVIVVSILEGALKVIIFFMLFGSQAKNSGNSGNTNVEMQAVKGGANRNRGGPAIDT